MTDGVPLRPPGKVTDRFLAFLVDLVPFFLGFHVTLYISVFKLHRMPNTWPVWHRQMLVWAVLWLAYHAVGNASGATVGKRLFGLRVEAADGGRLPAPRAVLRALGYLLSLPLNLGFLWSLFQSDSRTWHDLLAGSRVAEAGPKSQGSALTSVVVSFVVLAGMVSYSTWAALAKPTRADLEAVRKAREGLGILAAVEESYKAANGRFTSSLPELAKASGDVAAFKQGMLELFDPDGFVIETGGGGYLLHARARDRRRTVVELAGP